MGERRGGNAVSRSRRDLPVRALYEAKTIAARYPAVALPLAHVLGRNHPIGPDTEIVIEGFPRSATSFAVAAFELAQGRKPVTAHHVHAPAQVIEAVRRRIPVLLLIREPEEAVLSYVVRRPELTVGQALRGYVRFYAPLVAYRKDVVIGAYPRVVTRFGDVINEVNQRFGTSFVPFEHTAANVRTCLDTIEAYVRRNHPPERFERVVPRPSAERSALKEGIRPRYHAESLARWRNRAEALYRDLAND